jgi:hypothetical protein
MKKPYIKYFVYINGKKYETMARSEKEAKSRVIGSQLGLAGDYDYYEIAEIAKVINADEKEREEKIKMNLGFDLKDWEETEAKEFGEFEVLELGGHEVVIKGASLYKSEQSGNTSLKVEVDIADNDKQASYFQKQYDNNTNDDKKWPAGAVRYLSLKKENLGYTKGFITALENSNKGFKFSTSKGWEQLKNLKCAGVFGLEEYLDNEGNKKTVTKLQNFRSLDKLSEIKIPKVKLLNNIYVEYETYLRQKNDDNSGNIFDDFEDTVEIDANFLD